MKRYFLYAINVALACIASILILSNIVMTESYSWRHPERTPKQVYYDLYPYNLYMGIGSMCGIGLFLGNTFLLAYINFNRKASHESKRINRDSI